METEKIRELEQGYVFGFTTSKDNIGIFRAGCNTEEIECLEVYAERCNEVASGSLAVVALDGEARIMRVHLKNEHVLLEEPKNLDFPTSVGELVALDKEEAKTRLEVLAQIKKFAFSLVPLKSNKGAADE